jgi:hypothetical protein
MRAIPRPPQPIVATPAVASIWAGQGPRAEIQLDVGYSRGYNASYAKRVHAS